MTKDESISISAKIGAYISQNAPTVHYTLDEIAEAMAEFSKEDLAEIAELGLYDGDFEKFYVIREFLSDIGLGDVADGEYILRVFEKAKKLDAKAFCSDPFMAILGDMPKRSGSCMLMPSAYDAGEILCYDAPDFSEDLVVPKLGFFTKRVMFPTLYENDLPWMSLCPSEINSMASPIAAAKGRVLVLGLGLGYYAWKVAAKEEVESVTVVELSHEVIDLFEKAIKPRLDFGGKLQIVKADAIAYLDGVKSGDFDFCFADIWEGAVDGAKWYRQILPHEKRLKGTEFTYWIEDAILAYLKDGQ